MKVSIQQYAKTLLELTENKSQDEVSKIIARFAEVLKTGGQMKNASKIIEKFTELYNANHGIVEAIVVTSGKAENLDKIEKFIKEKYKAKEVIVKNIVDKKIKGGIIIKVGDEILDGSVSSQLKRLRSVLIK